MKIGIFGHSKAVYKKRSYVHYTERINNYFSQHQINWYGTQCTSVERLAYSISKNYCDLYIILHTALDYVYCPGWSRDFPADVLFKAMRTEKGWERFLLNCERYSISYNNNLFENLDFFKNIFYDKNRHLNFIANLFLIKSLLVGKKAIHVRHNGEEVKVFRNDYFSKSIEQTLNSVDPDGDWDHALISNVFIQEIELALTK